MGKPFDSKSFMNLTSPPGEAGPWRIYSPDNMKPGVFTPSLNNFDKPKSFMDDVIESVVSEKIKYNKQQLGSPSWAWKAQENLNHTGEQPLIVQQYLSSNKKEQEDGVLPAKQPHKERFLSHSASSAGYRSKRLYQLSITAHQFLTATEMPNESEKIVDHRLGRPTRTSLLRARRRIPSAPGVKATVEFKTNLHIQQNLVAKREDKHKTVDIPEELLPITDNGETVHQFLVGARYNRGHYRDAKCLSELGLYVCRDDNTNCFLRPSSSHHHASPRTLASDSLSNGQSKSLSSMRSAEASTSKTSSLRPKRGRATVKSKQAWTTGSIDSSPLNTLPTDGKNSFDNARNQSRPGTKVKVIDGSCLETRLDQNTASSLQDDGCVLCQTGVTTTAAALCKRSNSPAWSKSERRNSDPVRLWSGKKRQNVKRGGGGTEDRTAEERSNRGKPNEEAALKIPKQVREMVLQQYHLRIMGTKVGVKHGIPSAPRSNFLYQNVTTTKSSPQAASSKSRGNTNSNIHKNRKSTHGSFPEPERPPSELSVHITSSKSSNVEENGDGGSCYDRDAIGSKGKIQDGKVEVNQSKKSMNEDEQLDVETGYMRSNQQNNDSILSDDHIIVNQLLDKCYLAMASPEGENVNKNELNQEKSNCENNNGESVVPRGDIDGNRDEVVATGERLDNLRIDDKREGDILN